MENKDLKHYAGTVVVESKLSKASKLQMLEFLKTASTPQVKVFIMDGKIAKLDEQSEQIANDRFEVYKEEASTGKSILGIFLAGPLYWPLYRWARSAVDQCNKKCGTFNIGDKRNKCMNDCNAKVKAAIQSKKSAIDAKKK